MASKPLEPGDPLRLGRFELLGRLGEGGQGVVYLGRGTGPGEDRVAVKVLRSAVDPLVLERLGRELDAIHQVQPFVTAHVIEASAEGDRRYVVSEFIDGPSLQERVDARGPLPEGDLQRLAVGTATALTAIHGAGVVHRDFKPANVLLGPDGPRVVDFGIARLTDVATITSGVIGTPSYMSPEQLAGARATSAVDIFAWAVTMIFAATGRSAFGADTVPAVMNRIMNGEPDLAGVPPALLPMVRECLAKDPARRPSARDLLLGLVDPSARRPLETTFDPVPVEATGLMPAPGGPEPTELSQPRTPAAPFPSSAPPSRSRRGPVLAVAGAVVAAAVAAAVVLLLTRNSPPGHAAAGTSGSGTPAFASSATGGASSSAPPAAAGATGPVIPVAFAGVWSGSAVQSSLGTPSVSLAPNAIQFTFVTGARTIHETEAGGCVNTLTLTGATSTALTFNEPQTAVCVPGTVTFTRHGANLAYRWTDNVLEQETALLHQH